MKKIQKNRKKKTNKCSEQLGSIPLIDAVASGDANLVKFLLAAGANVHAKNNKGQTALSSAARSLVINEEIIKIIIMLLNNDANPNDIDNENLTVLNCLFKYPLLQFSPLFIKAVEILLEKGANPNIGKFAFWELDLASPNLRKITWTTNLEYVRTMLLNENLANLLIEYGAKE